MKKSLLLLFLILMATAPVFSQQQITFKSIVESINPDEDKIWEVRERLSEAYIDTVIGPRKMSETYFKRIGIGLLGNPNKEADVLVVHLKETNQKSDAFFFKPNIKLAEITKKLGKPEQMYYAPETGLVALSYTTKEGHPLRYEIYNVDLKDSLDQAHYNSFKKLFPHVKRLSVDYMYAFLFTENVPEPQQLK